MRGHDKSNIRSGSRELIYHYSFFIHIHCAHFTGQIFKKSVSLSVRGIFQRYLMPVSDDHDQKHQEVVASRSYDHLVRPAFDSPCLVEIAADRISKPVLSLRISQPEQFRPVIGKALPGKSSPCIIRKTFQIHSIRRKIILILFF